MYAYPGLLGEGGVRNIGNTLMLTYTYLQPGETFVNRYMAWRNVSLEQVADSDTAPLGRVQLARYYQPATRTMWATTQMIPAGLNFTFVDAPGLLLTSGERNGRTAGF